MRRFDGKVAFLTGAAHGIGYACAKRLSAEGARVVVADIDAEAAKRAARELDGLAVACDVRDRASVEAAVAAAVDAFGRLDVLVNNVGIASGLAFADLDDDEWQRIVDPTLVGAMRCVRACLEWLLAAPDGGAVVSIASVNGMGAVGEVPYSAAKAGLISASTNLAVQYGRRARGARDAEAGWVRFNVVAPGTIRTRVWTDNGPEQAAQLERLKDLYPAGRVGEPEDVAAAVAFLAAPEAEWITGVTLPVDGGLMVGPAATATILDR
ncbi:SDR family oxidoreductase [Stackebrandtia nassauensis]|uniref:SDR family NAD(P)-dependent oxidoreductase n=1 Tax=Stackebrandtia nassauensis TaxID=283811 RepID=UPI000A06BEAF